MKAETVTSEFPFVILTLRSRGTNRHSSWVNLTRFLWTDSQNLI